MPAIVLYSATSAALIALWSRVERGRISRAAAIVLFLLPFCFVGRALLTGRVYAPVDLAYGTEPLRDYARDFGLTHVHNGWLTDLSMQIIPWQSAVRQALTAGEWPLWNRHMLAGTLLASNMQSAVYDPLQILGLLLRHPQALTYAAAMTFFIAGLFTFLFARALGRSEPAALTAAAGYMFSTAFAFFVGWPLARAWAWFPLVLVGVRMVVRETGVRAGVVLTASLVLLILAGHPETVLHAVMVGALYGLYEVVSTRNFKSIGVAAICGVLALLLTAVSLMPFFSVMPESEEHLGRRVIYAPNPLGVTDEAVMRNAAHAVFPFYGGRPEHQSNTPLFQPGAFRVGSLILTLAIAAPFVARSRDTWFFLALAAFTAWSGLNGFPIADLLHSLPLFDIALNDRLGFAAVFSLAILAAFALDGLSGVVPVERRAPAAPLFIVVIAIVAIGAGSLLLRESQIAAGVPSDLITGMTLAELLPLTALAILLVLRAPGRIALPAILGLVLLQRTYEDGAIYPAHSEKAFYPVIPILRQIQQDTRTPFRVIGHDYAFVPDAAALYGLEDARGYEAMTFLRLFQTYPLWSTTDAVWFNRVLDLKKPFLSMLNIRYAIAPRTQQPDEPWKLVLEDRESRLFENTRVLPRAYVPKQIRYEQITAAVLEEMATINDFGDASVITLPDSGPHETANGPGTLRITRRGSRYDIEADMKGDGWVIVSESAWKGWRYYIDGKRNQWRYANHAFLGLFVPAGKHQLRLVYWPEAFTRGRNITLFTIAGLGVFFVLRRRHRLQQPRAI